MRRLFAYAVTCLWSLALAFMPLHAFAAFSSSAVSPPSGWGGSSAAGWTYTAGTGSANAPWINGTARGNVLVNVGGKTITAPAAWRMASNAPRIGALAIRAAGGGVAWAVSSVVLPWLAVGAIVWAVDHWAVNEPSGTFPGYCVAGTSACGATPSDAMTQFLPTLNATRPPWIWHLSGCSGTANCTAQGYFNGTPDNMFDTRSIAVGTYASPPSQRPAVDADWDKLSPPTPLPVAQPALDTLPVPLPVGLPALNPDPLPALDPLPHPLFVPTGLPVPIPGTNPQQYQQPGVDIVPAPTPISPWQVDLQPKTATGTDPNGSPLPAETPASAPDLKPWCGLPGLPDCTVKVDEVGTADADPTAVAAGKVAATAATDSIADKVAHPESWVPTFPTLAWSFALPTGCAVISTPSFEPFLTGIDICQFQPVFHDVMSVVWIIGGLFGAIQLFLRDALAS